MYHFVFIFTFISDINSSLNIDGLSKSSASAKIHSLTSQKIDINCNNNSTAMDQQGITSFVDSSIVRKNKIFISFL